MSSTLPFWVIPVFIILSLIAWGILHFEIRDKKIDQNISRILVMEMVPAFAFAATAVYLFLPAIYYLIATQRFEWATQGIFWRLSTFIGAAIFTFSLVSWVALLEDDVEAEDIDTDPALTEVAEEARDSD